MTLCTPHIIEYENINNEYMNIYICLYVIIDGALPTQCTLGFELFPGTAIK